MPTWRVFNQLIAANRRLLEQQKSFLSTASRNSSFPKLRLCTITGPSSGRCWTMHGPRVRAPHAIFTAMADHAGHVASTRAHATEENRHVLTSSARILVSSPLLTRQCVNLVSITIGNGTTRTANRPNTFVGKMLQMVRPRWLGTTVGNGRDPSRWN